MLLSLDENPLTDNLAPAAQTGGDGTTPRYQDNEAGQVTYSARVWRPLAWRWVIRFQRAAFPA